jgi:hypothetical protein
MSGVLPSMGKQVVELPPMHKSAEIGPDDRKHMASAKFKGMWSIPHHSCMLVNLAGAEWQNL